MIKIVGVISSPRKQGNSATLVRRALAGSKAGGGEVEELFLPEYNLEFCQGCFACLKRGSCALTDDLEMLRDKLKEADGLVVSSPTHGLEPNAIMKNFMDRIGLFSAYTSFLADKYVVSISTTGAVGAKRVAKKLTSINSGFAQTGYVSGIQAVALDWDHVSDYPEYLEEAFELGQRLVEDIQTGKKYYTQKIFSRLINGLFVKRVMKKNILQHKDGRLKAVYEYLRKEGRL